MKIPNRQTLQAIHNWFHRIGDGGVARIYYVNALNVRSAYVDNFDLVTLPFSIVSPPYMDKLLMQELFQASPPMFQFWIRRKAGIHPMKKLEHLTATEWDCIQVAVLIKIKENNQRIIDRLNGW